MSLLEVIDQAKIANNTDEELQQMRNIAAELETIGR